MALLVYTTMKQCKFTESIVKKLTKLTHTNNTHTAWHAHMKTQTVRMHTHDRAQAHIMRLCVTAYRIQQFQM
jgi:hypothetical protein